MPTDNIIAIGGQSGSLYPAFVGGPSWNSIRRGAQSGANWPGFLASVTTGNNTGVYSNGSKRSGIGYELVNWFGSTYYQLHRVFLNFDLSNIPDNATITEVKLKLFFREPHDVVRDDMPKAMVVAGLNDDTLATGDWLAFVGGDGTSGSTDIHTGVPGPDWDKDGTRPYLDSEATLSSLGSYTEMTLNSTALLDAQAAYENDESFKTVTMDNDYDFEDLTPTLPGGESLPYYGLVGMDISTRPSGSSANVPILEVTYDVQAPGVTNSIRFFSGTTTIKAGNFHIN